MKEVVVILLIYLANGSTYEHKNVFVGPEAKAKTACEEQAAIVIDDLELEGKKVVKAECLTLFKGKKESKER